LTDSDGIGEDLTSSSQISCAAFVTAVLSPAAAFSQIASILLRTLAESEVAEWTPFLQAATAAAPPGLLEVFVVDVDAGVEVVAAVDVVAAVEAAVELDELLELELPQPAMSKAPVSDRSSHAENLRFIFTPWFEYVGTTSRLPAFHAA
jgi:hypothetical protein